MSRSPSPLTLTFIIMLYMYSVSYVTQTTTFCEIGVYTREMMQNVLSLAVTTNNEKYSQRRLTFLSTTEIFL